jgi:hypothetical protein
MNQIGNGSRRAQLGPLLKKPFFDKKNGFFCLMISYYFITVAFYVPIIPGNIYYALTITPGSLVDRF